MTLKVLICDDSSLARKQVKKSLPTDWDAKIDFASNGLEAVEMIAKQKIEVLFLDLTMPVLDGVGVLERLQAKHKNIVIIVISADIQPEMQKKVRQLGAVEFIPKPVNADRVREVLTKYDLI